MATTITEEDFRLVDQRIVDLMIELTVYDSNGNLLDTLYGVIDGGSITVSAGSNVRRTASFRLTPTKQITNLTEQSLVWLNKTVKVRLGILNQRTRQRKWYACGSYFYQDANSTYDASTNEMAITLSDFMLKLDGTINGQIGGALTTVVPAYEENPDTGEPISYNSISKALEDTLRQLAGMTGSDFIINDIGEYMAMPQYNDNYLAYREKFPLWGMIPYDLEFSTGATVYEIIESLVNLYPNYDAAFNEDGVFVVQMIPSAYSDEVVIPFEKYKNMLLSESVQTDLTTVKNICEVWGETVDAQYFADNIGFNNLDIYTVTLDGYKKYEVGDRFAFIFKTPSISGQLLKINNLESMVIYNDYDDEVIGDGDIDTEHIHIFKITQAKNDAGKYFKKLVYLGVDQSHGVNVLTDGTVVKNGYVDASGTYDLYSMKYYQHIFNCDNISFTVIKDSPFTVQKLGNRIDVKSGGEFENITSEQLALERAEYENWKNCRLTDTVTITTKLMPFAKPFQKATYIKNGFNELEQFIIQDVSHDLDNGTTSITMYKFYPLYDGSENWRITYGEMSAYKNGMLTNKEIYTKEV